ncbi:MAG: hypothetical protein ACI80V_001028 [Rhodothermales bacterium]|jgi:hypothetical protein
MQAISLNPTVAALTRSRERALQNRPPAGVALRSLNATGTSPFKLVSGGFPRLFIHTLRRALASSTNMQVSVAVPTPVGATQAEVVLNTGDRRVAVLVGPKSREREALLLVYGAFDSILRISLGDAKGAALAVVALIEAAEPEFFLGETARLASLTTVRRVMVGRKTITAEGWDGTMSATLHRRRINRPAEWAADFEAAVSQPANRRRAS